MTGTPKGRPPSGRAATGASILDGALLTPILTIDRPALRRNLDAMARFLEPLGVELAPHVKTHLSPELWRMQEAAGATRATVATAAQALALHGAGVRRILVASEVIAPGDLAALAGAVVEGLDVLVFCDSPAGVSALSAAASAAGVEAGVLVDVGPRGWRTGCRTVEDALAVARAAVAAEGVRLEGVAGYEGVLSAIDDGREAAIEDFLGLAVDALRALDAAGLLPDDPLVSFGGSDLYPAVLECVLPAAREAGARLQLRSGCYLFHDHGKYERAQREVPSALGKPWFEPTIGVWAPIVSAPEPGLAVAGLGRRDAGADAGLPRALRRARGVGVAAGRSPEPGGPRVPELADATSVASRAIYDQHLVLADPEGVLAVGDLVEFGISHPCSTLDRWSHALLVEGLTPVEVVRLLFP